MGTIAKTPDALSLLIVEDDQEARGVMCTLLARKFPEITIHVAENGTQGVDLCKAHLPEIVITDINMPIMDGILMAEAIKAVKADTRFIVLTGYSDKMHLDKFSDIGIHVYMLKPIEFRKLFAAIEAYQEELRQERQ